MTPYQQLGKALLDVRNARAFCRSLTVLDDRTVEAQFIYERAVTRLIEAAEKVLVVEEVPREA